MLINSAPGVRIVDTALEEIGTASGHFRLVISARPGTSMPSFGLDNLGSSRSARGRPMRPRPSTPMIARATRWRSILSPSPGDPRELRFARLSYDAPVGVDGLRLGASGLYSEVRPGDCRRLTADNTKTEAFELRGSIVPLMSQKSDA